MIQILEKSSEKDGLIAKSLMAEIGKPLIFMPVLDVQGICFAVTAYTQLKRSLVFPTETAPMGVVGKWAKPKV